VTQEITVPLECPEELLYGNLETTDEELEAT
jgi:hypothetical protein